MIQHLNSFLTRWADAPLDHPATYIVGVIVVTWLGTAFVCALCDAEERGGWNS
jgi:hypothetical protein